MAKKQNSVPTIPKLRDIMSKKAFMRISSVGYANQGTTIDGNVSDNDKPIWQIVSQADFLREYYPSGHAINDPLYYPDRQKIDPVTKRIIVEKVIRCSFPLQKVITTKQVIHLCGNDIRFELTEPQETEKQKDMFFKLKKGWQMKHTESNWFNCALSAKVTGEAAIVGYLNKGVFGWRTFSYLSGDKLYPQYDEFGKLIIFAREYKSYDEDGKNTTSFVEVWDENKYYLYKRPLNGVGGLISEIKEMFQLQGYALVRSNNHGFDNIPVAYYRNDDGACWSDSQDSIDKYELAVSHLCQNNMAYAFPILFLKGDDITIQGGEDIYRPVKAITGDKDSNADYLTNPDGSASFELQLKILLQNIFMGSFTVLPPELKSGDLPGVAVKLLYSPAIEKAMADASQFDSFIADMLNIFAHGYGLEIGEMTAMKSLKINSWIEPYVHQNIAELMQNLQVGVFGGFLSKETASEAAPYSKADEWYRIMKQQNAMDAEASREAGEIPQPQEPPIDNQAKPNVE